VDDLAKTCWGCRNARLANLGTQQHVLCHPGNWKGPECAARILATLDQTQYLANSSGPTSGRTSNPKQNADRTQAAYEEHFKRSNVARQAVTADCGKSAFAKNGNEL